MDWAAKNLCSFPSISLWPWAAALHLLLASQMRKQEVSEARQIDFTGHFDLKGELGETEAAHISSPDDV